MVQLASHYLYSFDQTILTRFLRFRRSNSQERDEIPSGAKAHTHFVALRHD